MDNNSYEDDAILGNVSGVQRAKWCRIVGDQR